MLKLGTVVLVAALAATAQTDPKADDAAIARVKNTMVSQLQPGMQKVTLEQYLQTQSGGGSTIKWEVNDCGEQTGDPANRDITNPPICVEADVTNTRGATATLFIAVGTAKTGTKGKPKVFSISFKDAKGRIKELRRIGQIPLEFGNDSGS